MHIGNNLHDKHISLSKLLCANIISFIPAFHMISPVIEYLWSYSWENHFSYFSTLFAFRNPCPLFDAVSRHDDIGWRLLHCHTSLLYFAFGRHKKLCEISFLQFLQRLFRLVGIIHRENRVSSVFVSLARANCSQSCQSIYALGIWFLLIRQFLKLPCFRVLVFK